jgi:ATP adenylyltransferase
MCIFCNIHSNQIVEENALAFAIRDRYPVTDGHTLIISKSHKASFFSLTEEERHCVLLLLDSQGALIRKEFSEVTAFNIGINDGFDSGQTIPHCHVHLIPRRAGDMIDPRGGVRGVIPEKQKY